MPPHSFAWSDRPAAGISLEFASRGLFIDRFEQGGVDLHRSALSEHLYLQNEARRPKLLNEDALQSLKRSGGNTAMASDRREWIRIEHRIPCQGLLKRKQIAEQAGLVNHFYHAAEPIRREGRVALFGASAEENV